MVDSEGQDHLKGAQAFDRNALAAIYDEFHEPLYRYVYRQVHDVEIARDLVAEVFKRLLQAIQRGRGPEQNLKAWLYRAAHNAVIDHYRSQQFRQHLPLDEQVIVAKDDPVDVAEEHLRAETIKNALIHLTPVQQQVISLKFLAGYSNQETAMILDKPIGAIKSLQHRALAALRRQLNPENEKA